MFDQLRKSLTLLNVGMTTAILILIVCIAFNFSAQELNRRSHLALENQMFTITQQFESSPYLSHSWLASQEASNHSIISIATQKGPFLFPGSYNPDIDRDTLIQQARKIGADKYHFSALEQSFISSAGSSVSFSFYNGSRHYLACIASLEHNMYTYEIIIIRNMAPDDHTLIWLALIFILIILLGIFLLGFFSWWFAGKVIKPIITSHQEQIDFVSAASHELRSPVAVIQAVTEEMMTDSSNNLKQSLDTIHHECSRLSKLIADLLLIARADSGRWSVHKEAVEADTLLLNTYDHFLPLVEAHHQHLTISLPDEVMAPVFLDPHRIEQVLAILIDNAMSYVPSGGHILLSLVYTPSHIEIGVTDDGPGIPDELKPKVFKRFYRTDQSRTDTSHYGLGLSIAYEIIKYHHGQLLLEDAPSGGCAFKIILQRSPSTRRV